MNPDDLPTEELPAIVLPAPPGTRGIMLRNRPIVIAVAATILVSLLAGAGVLAWPLLFQPATAATGAEVFLEPMAAPGRDPFTGNVVLGNPAGVKSQTPARATGGGTPTVVGDTPALYGGSRNEKVCDKQQLITFLQQNPRKATAWATVLGLQPEQVPDYIGTLTPVQLRADTRVTNHGYLDGRATPRQSVLEAGTAVLVDKLGQPRVKCGCGNPLAGPVPTSTAARYIGDPWPGFNPRALSAVSPAKTQIDRFVVYDVRSGETFYRVSGTSGETDEPTTPPPLPTTTTTTRSPAPTAAPCPDGQQRSNGSCVPTTPAACPAGQDRVDGRCVTRTPISCPPGTHPVSDGTACQPDAPVVCPPGSHLVSDGTACEPDGPIQCPPGHHPVSDGTACEPDPIECPPGYHPVSDGTACEQDKPVECPPGYHPVSDGTACEQDKPVECPPGYHPVSDGTACEQDKPVECPPGTHLGSDGTSCLPDASETPCPPGTEPNGSGGCRDVVGRRPGTRRRDRGGRGAP